MVSLPPASPAVRALGLSGRPPLPDEVVDGHPHGAALTVDIDLPDGKSWIERDLVDDAVSHIGR
jgi:hypothetical protein